ncbi:zinc finger and SCAN domain-containing protein 20-like [Gadus chalcogrammus]|uniref:zinc finger and SCAN domain-containing protein 20-like n=1 Tax=Gadus chalcogrammus TaxID=1042646 RepID=UPI0024C48F74|nr:zinc finger and SCAN domain-containing protein 20-like [Gadus chalcogrammus]
MSRKGMVWTNREVETFLCILGEEDVQRDLDGAARNEKVFQLVSQKLLDAGFEKNTEQCRQKSKKLRADYRKAKDHNNQNGDYRKMWKWFNMMDAIYGHRLESKGTEIDTANSMLESKLQPIATELTSPAEGSRRAMRAAYQAPSLSTRLKEPNPEELFLLSLAPMLQSLEPEKLSEAKIQIMSVIHRAQFN